MFLARPRREAVLAEQGGLLVPGDARDRHRGAKQVRGRLAIDFARGPHLGQQLARHVQQAQQLLVPRAGMQVEQQGAGGVARIGEVERAAGQLPQQPGVNRAEGQFAAPRPLPGARHVVQQPANLAAREIGVNDQARLARDQVAVAGALELVAEPGGAAVLPDDGVMDGLAGSAVPDDGGLALIGDADGRDVCGASARRGPARSGRPRAGWTRFRSGSCSTQPACGKICGNSFWALARIAPA